VCLLGYLIYHYRLEGGLMDQQRAGPSLPHDVVAGTGVAREDNAPPISVLQGDRPGIRTMLHRYQPDDIHPYTDLWLSNAQTSVV